MKKTILIVIIALACAIGITYGSAVLRSRQSEVCEVAVLAKSDTNEGLIVVLGADNKLLREYHTDYITNAFFGQDGVWFSLDDGQSYQKMTYKDFTVAASYQDVGGDLVYASEAGYFADGSSDNAARYNASTETKLSFDYYFIDVKQAGEYLYVLASNNTITVYRQQDFSSLGQYVVNDGQGYMALTSIGDKVYYVTQAGYVSLGLENIDTTYLYPVSFDSISYANGKYLGLMDASGTEKRYTISFDEYRMILTADTQENSEVDFAAKLASQYSRGYEVEIYQNYQQGE